MTERKTFKNITVEDYEEDCDEYVCSVCSERFTNSNWMEIHMQDHVRSSRVTLSKQRFKTSCGCSFKSMEEAELHLKSQRKLTGFYEYRLKNFQRVVYVAHVREWDFDRAYDGFEVSEEKIGMMQDKVRFPSIFEVVGYKELPIGVMESYRRITKDRFIERVDEIQSIIRRRIECEISRGTP